jgi:hemerythrin
MDLTWSKRLSVGNATLDAEHQQIFRLIHEVDSAIREKSVACFSDTLKRLTDTSRLHFANESKIAQAINYDFEHHDLEHQYILNEMQIIEEELIIRQGKWSESVVEHYFQFLSTWAVDHIDQDDMKMKATLGAYPYDFKPNEVG